MSMAQIITILNIPRVAVALPLTGVSLTASLSVIRLLLVLNTRAMRDLDFVEA